MAFDAEKAIYSPVNKTFKFNKITSKGFLMDFNSLLYVIFRKIKFTQIAAEKDKKQNGLRDKHVNLIFTSSDGFCYRNVIFCVSVYTDVKPNIPMK